MKRKLLSFIIIFVLLFTFIIPANAIPSPLTLIGLGNVLQAELVLGSIMINTMGFRFRDFNDFMQTVKFGYASLGQASKLVIDTYATQYNRNKSMILNVGTNNFNTIKSDITKSYNYEDTSFLFNGYTPISTYNLINNYSQLSWNNFVSFPTPIDTTINKTNYMFNKGGLYFIDDTGVLYRDSLMNKPSVDMMANQEFFINNIFIYSVCGYTSSGNLYYDFKGGSEYNAGTPSRWFINSGGASSGFPGPNGFIGASSGSWDSNNIKPVDFVIIPYSPSLTIVSGVTNIGSLGNTIALSPDTLLKEDNPDIAIPLPYQDSKGRIYVPQSGVSVADGVAPDVLVDNPATDGALPSDITSGVADLSQSIADIFTPPISSSFEDSADRFKIPTLITTKFPFSIPFDLLRAFDMLNSPAVTPSFIFPFKIDSIGIDESININLENFNEMALVLRWFQSALFILLLIYSTRKLINA